jgi:hypothetical protein
LVSGRVETEGFKSLHSTLSQLPLKGPRGGVLLRGAHADS